MNEKKKGGGKEVLKEADGIISFTSSYESATGKNVKLNRRER